MNKPPNDHPYLHPPRVIFKHPDGWRLAMYPNTETRQPQLEVILPDRRRNVYVWEEYPSTVRMANNKRGYWRNILTEFYFDMHTSQYVDIVFDAYKEAEDLIKATNGNDTP